MWNTLRTFLNRAGVTFDALKTTVIFAEDMNDIKENLEYLKDNQINTKSFVITNPTALSDLPLMRVPVGVTITAVHLLCKGNVTVGQLYQYDENGLNGATVDSSDITGVVDTNVDSDGTLSAPAITAGHYIGWKTTSITGAPTYAIITFDFILT